MQLKITPKFNIIPKILPMVGVDFIVLQCMALADAVDKPWRVSDMLHAGGAKGLQATTVGRVPELTPWEKMNAPLDRIPSWNAGLPSSQGVELAGS